MQCVCLYVHVCVCMSVCVRVCMCVVVKFYRVSDSFVYLDTMQPNTH